MSVLHCVRVTICQCCTVLELQYVSVALCQSYNMSVLHCVRVTICKCYTVLELQYVSVTLC